MRCKEMIPFVPSFFLSLSSFPTSQLPLRSKKVFLLRETQMFLPALLQRTTNNEQHPSSHLLLPISPSLVSRFAGTFPFLFSFWGGDGGESCGEKANAVEGDRLLPMFSFPPKIPFSDLLFPNDTCKKKKGKQEPHSFRYYYGPLLSFSCCLS